MRNLYLIVFIFLVVYKTVRTGFFFSDDTVGKTNKETVPENAAEKVTETADEDLVLTITSPEKIAVTRQYLAYRGYCVKKGDTLWSIAEEYRGNALDYQFLAEWNSIENADLIFEGQILSIPVDTTETCLVNNDWCYQNDIYIRSEGRFSIPVHMQNRQTGEITIVPDVSIDAQIRTIDLDFKKSGYQLIEATFETDVENLPFSESRLYFYYEAADRYTGISFIQNSTKIVESDTNGLEIYELSIVNEEQGYAGTVCISVSSVNNCMTIAAEVPKEYDGLFFGFGEYFFVDKNKYETDTLYKLDQFDIENTVQYYFSADGY